MPEILVQFSGEDTGYTARVEIAVDDDELDILKYFLSKLNAQDPVPNAKGRVFARVWNMSECGAPISLEGIYP